MQAYTDLYFNIIVHTSSIEITDILNFKAPGHGLGSTSSCPS